MAYIIETAATDTYETGLHFIGQQDELDALQGRLVPAALEALAGDHIGADEAMDIVRFASYDHSSAIPNLVKRAAIKVLYDADASMRGRELSVITSAAAGMLTTAQVIEETKLLAELRSRELVLTWLTSQGLLALPNDEGRLDVLAHDRQSEYWAALEPSQITTADMLGATHLLTQYELDYEPFDTSTPIPRLLSDDEHFVLASRDDQGFTLLASVIGPNHLGFRVP